MSQISSLVKQAISYFKNEDFINAKLYVEKILKQDPNNYDALNLSGVLFGFEGRHKKASEYFKKCISKPEVFAVVHLSYGITTFQLHSPENPVVAVAKASRQFEKAIALAPELPEIPNLYGEVMLAG